MQYININTPYGSPSSASPRFPSHLELGLPRSRSNSLDTEYRGSLDSEPELRTVKDLVPRHLRKSWRLLHAANTGTYEAHITAVQELSKLNLTDPEYRQVKTRAARLLRTCDIRLTHFNPTEKLILCFCRSHKVATTGRRWGWPALPGST